MSSKQQRYIAHFQPQAWQDDWAVNVDAKGPQEWDCTEYLRGEPTLLAEVEIELQQGNRWLDTGDHLFYNDTQMPAWMKKQGGPFDIHVRYRTQYDTNIPESVKTRPDMIGVVGSGEPAEGWHYVDHDGTFCGHKVSSFMHLTRDPREDEKVECLACLLKNNERQLTAEELRTDLIEACNSYFVNDHAMMLIDQLVATLTEKP